MNRKDSLIEEITKKSFTEEIMKSLGWATLCGVVLSMSIVAFKSDDLFTGVFILGIFIVLVTLSIIYFALYIAIPLDSVINEGSEYWDEKSQMLEGFPKLIAAAKIFSAAMASLI